MRSHVTQIMRLLKRTFAVMLAVAFACLSLPSGALAAENDDLFLAMFMDRSWGGTTDYLYVSFDGKTFESLGTPYKPLGDGSDVFAYVGGNAQNTLHDPGIGYYDGVFWTMSGFTIDWNGGWKFIPMFGSSRDLVNWTYPARPEGVPGTVSPAPDTKNKHAENRIAEGQFDCAGPDFMFDDNGDCYIVVPLGYYGDFHGEPYVDYMQPYICKVSGLARSAYNDAGTEDWQRGWAPEGTSGDFTRINLPVYSENWIDPSLYKENGKYYLSIKKDGITNYIFEIDDLSQAGDSGAWRTKNSNVVTGYEGPCLTKGKDLFEGTDKYFFYTDKLDSYYSDTDPNGSGYNGIFYQISASMSEGWSWPQRITTKDVYGNTIHNRHGSVTRITDPDAKELILNLRSSLGYTRFTDVTAVGDNKTPHAKHILWLADAGVTTGYPDYTYRGQVPVYRQDMAAFLYRLAGSPEYEVVEEDLAMFSDVNESTPHYREICWLASTGISKGWEEADGSFTFRGMDTVKRQDMAAFLHRLAIHQLGDDAPEGGTDNIFSDVNESTPHYEDIIWLASTGVTTGWDEVDGTCTYRGMSDVVRQDMAAFLHRMSDKVL